MWPKSQTTPATDTRPNPIQGGRHRKRHRTRPQKEKGAARSPFSRRFSRGGEREEEGRTLARHRFCPYRPAVALDDPPDERQSDPGALVFPGVVEPGELVEDMGSLLRRKPDTVVGGRE